MVAMPTACARVHRRRTRVTPQLVPDDHIEYQRGRLMHATKQVLATAFTAVIASAGLVAATDVAAHADNTAVSIEKQGTRSASHKILFVRARVVCSEDTTSAGLSAYVEQTNPAGGTQHAWS